MKFFAGPLVVLAALATAVLAQGSGFESVDDLFERDDDLTMMQINARDFEELQSRHAEEIFFAKRDLERLERRSKSVCYAGCQSLSGDNKQACYKKCDKIWGRKH
ncbi:hypothetical protein CPC08DRAFT_755584 [Agrocybe pediades]|nr:hypothetical protein CPC08DRAFT_755584 [Agrocybe pediades]